MSERARLRLAAANSLLMLASSLPDINEIMTLEQFLYLALTIQDPCDEVRDGFVAKLGKFVITQTLSLRYISIFCLSPAVETRKTAKAEIKSMLSEAIQVRRKYYTSNPSAKDNYTNILPEYSLSFAVYLLSHHPSFDRSNVKILELFRDCLWFYLEPLLYKTDNFNFLQQTLISIKQLKDSQHPDDDEVNKNIYAICDLALGILINKVYKTCSDDILVISNDVLYITRDLIQLMLSLCVL
jgi:sister-chromatid-cohesion protein PDS5